MNYIVKCHIKNELWSDEDASYRIYFNKEIKYIDYDYVEFNINDLSDIASIDEDQFDYVKIESEKDCFSSKLDTEFSDKLSVEDRKKIVSLHYKYPD